MSDRPFLIAVVTADRPSLLSRCLLSLDRELARYGAQVPVLVIDGSQSRNSRKENLAHCSSLSRLDIRYVDPAACSTLRSHLLEVLPAQDLLHAALFTGAIGASRNLALLLAAGTRVIMIDDDVVMDPWGDPDGGDVDLVLGGHTELRAWRFWRNRRAATKVAASRHGDVLGQHRKFLGTSLNDLVHASPTVSTEYACECMLRGADSSGSVVSLTVAGLAGDSARYCPYHLLLLGGTVREQLMASDRDLRVALESREVSRVAPWPLITHQLSEFSTYCAGLLNSKEGHPFPFIGRGEDTVFALAIGYLYPSAVMAHLPVGIVHDSRRASRYGRESLDGAKYFRLADLLASILGLCSQSVLRVAEDRRVHLTRRLRGLAALPLARFVESVAGLLLNVKCGQLLALDDAASNGSTSTLWRNAHRRYRKAFQAASCSQELFLPREFRAHTLENGFVSLQRHLADFAVLIESWPALWEAAREVDPVHLRS